MSTAATLLKDRLKSKDPTGRRRQTVRFGHTLETLLMATNDEPALITLMLEKDTLTKPDISRPDASGTSEALDKVAEDEETTVTTEEYPIETSINDQERRSSPMTGKEEHHRVIPTAAPETSLSGLRMAQLAVLLAGQNTSKQQKIKLTNEQLEQ